MHIWDRKVSLRIVWLAVRGNAREFCADFNCAYMMNPNYLGDPLTFSFAAPAGQSTYTVKYLIIYLVEWCKTLYTMNPRSKTFLLVSPSCGICDSKGNIRYYWINCY